MKGRQAGFKGLNEQDVVKAVVGEQAKGRTKYKDTHHAGDLEKFRAVQRPSRKAVRHSNTESHLAFHWVVDIATTKDLVCSGAAVTWRYADLKSDVEPLIAHPKKMMIGVGPSMRFLG